MKTFSAKPAEVERDWVLIDAAGQTLGRLASRIAMRLRGKHKPTFTPHVDTGDNVVIINAEQIKVTGKKTKKEYFRHTGYPGGIKSVEFDKLIATYPERIIMSAVKGMMPRGRLGRAMMKKLKVYAGSDHPHTAQQPEQLNEV